MKRILALVATGVVVGILAPFASVIPFEAMLVLVATLLVASYVWAFMQDYVTLAVRRLPRFTTVEARRAQLGLAA